MRVAIIADEDRVNVDGEPHKVDCSELRVTGISVVQWYGDEGEGEIEHKGTRKGRKPNSDFTDFSPYELFVERWKTEKARVDAEIAEIKKQEEEIRAKYQGRLL